MPKRPPSIPTLTIGESLFLFEGDTVRVLGSRGTEATVPLDDLRALLEYLAASQVPPSYASPGPEEKED